MLEAEVASIAKKMCDISEIENVYFDEVREGFKRPSLYFPPVEQTAIGDTLTSFAYDNAMFVKVFDKTTKGAMSIAEQITHAVSVGRNIIPFMSEEGEPTGKVFRIKDVSYKSVDVGAAQLYIRWKSIYSFTEATHNKVAKMVFNILSKGKEA